MKKQTKITPQFLHEVMTYDAETGLLHWKRRPIEMFPAERYWKIWNTKNAGKEAFTALTQGYKHGTVLGQKLMAHKVVWAMFYGEWPKQRTDHINQKRDDNRLVNLRSVSPQENSKNQRLRSTNTSGVNGVSWFKRDSTWQAQITIDGKNTGIGRFARIEDAIAAREKASRIHGFHENHGVAA